MSSPAMDAGTSGSMVSQIEADTLQTINLGQTVVQLVREPVAQFYRHYQKTQATKCSLGPWANEAYRRGLLETPQLLINDFENFLVRTVGLLRPQGEPPADASWEYLMHALGIEPGMEIVQWKRLLGDMVETQNGKIEMEIDAAVLCHVMNLYRFKNDWTALTARRAENWNDGFLECRVLENAEHKKECQLT